jgi:hypothetical protein
VHASGDGNISSVSRRTKTRRRKEDEAVNLCGLCALVRRLPDEIVYFFPVSGASLKLRTSGKKDHCRRFLGGKRPQLLFTFNSERQTHLPFYRLRLEYLFRKHKPPKLPALPMAHSLGNGLDKGPKNPDLSGYVLEITGKSKNKMAYRSI